MSQPKSRVRSASGQRKTSAQRIANLSGAQGNKIFTQSLMKTGARLQSAEQVSRGRKVQFSEVPKPRNVGFNQMVPAAGVAKGEPGLHAKTGSLAQEYMQRKKAVNNTVQKVIDQQKVASMTIAETTKQREQERAKEIELFKKNNPQLADLVQEVKLNQDGKLADGFVRSKRNLAMRVKDNLDNQMDEIEQEKIELVQRLNDALIRLDKVNASKRELSNDLVEKIKFVRDLQKATHMGDDIDSCVSQQMKDEYRREQQMNAQLREELKKCEMERLKIMERIKLLSGEKEIVVVRTNGMKKTYKVTTVNIERLLDDLRHFKDEILTSEDIITRTKSIVLQTEEQLGGVERQVAALRAERDQLMDKTTQLSVKYDDAVVSLESERQRMENMHQMHVKLLSTRQFEETMQKIIFRNKELALDQIIRVTQGDQRQYGAVWKFKQVCELNARKQMKRALHKWFTIACDPLSIIRLNQQIPLFYHRNKVFQYFFNRWRTHYIRRRQERVERNQVVVRCMRSLDNYWKRRSKVLFLCWRDQLIIKNEAIRTLYRFISDQRVIKTMKAFQKWKQVKQDQDFNMRMQYLGMKVAFKRLKASLFYAWRTWTRRQKIIKHGIKMRAFKNLRINVARNKQLAFMTLAALGVQNKREEKLKQLIFDALRQHKQDQKLELLESQLQNEEVPMIRRLSVAIKKVDSRSQYQTKHRAMKAIIAYLGRDIHSYFRKWKNSAVHKTYKSEKDVTRLIVKVYKSQLRDAFYTWRVHRNKTILFNQQGMIDAYTCTNSDLDTLIRRKNLKIKQKDQMVKSASSKQLRKLSIQAFQNNVQHYFRQWAVNTRLLTAKQGGAATILKKMRRRLLRVAFDRYRRKAKECRQDMYNENRLKDVKLRLQYRTKKKMFNAIRNFANNHHNATNVLRALLRSLDKHNKQSAFSRWQEFKNEQKDDQLREDQSQLVEELGEAQQAHADLSDKLNTARQTNNRLTKALKVEGKKTLQKWFQRSAMNSLRWGFIKWRSQGIKLRYRSKFLEFTAKHMGRNALKAAWLRWLQTSFEERRIEFTEMITDSTHGTELGEHNLSMAKKRKKKILDENSRHQAQVKKQIKDLNHRIGGVLNIIIKKNDENYFMSNIRHIVMSWREYTRRRKACCAILTKAINNTLLQTTFTEIKQFSRADEVLEAKQGRANQMAGIFQKFKLRKAFCLWRNHLYNKHKSLTHQEDVGYRKSVRDYERWKDRVNNQWYKILGREDDNKTLLQMFEAWRKYSYYQKDKRLKTERLREAIGVYKKRRAILKWNDRCRENRKAKYILWYGSHCKIRPLQLKMIFKAWKNEYLIDRYMATRTEHAMNQLKFVALKLAFKRIHTYSEIVDGHNIRSRKQACDKFAICLRSYADNWSRQCFNKWKVITFKDSIRYDAWKKMVLHLANHRMRSMFLHWKRKAKEREIMIQMEQEDGPVNLQLWNINVDRHNLEKLMLQDGMTMDEIEEFKSKQQRKFKYLAEKSLCRLLCKENSDLNLMPICLDRWRKYVQMRKMWRRAVTFCERRLYRSNYHATVQWAFEKMKYSESDRTKQLRRKTIHELRDYAVNNREKLKKLMEQVYGNDEGIGEYTEQRNVLLKGYIAGQKLALSSASNNHKRAMYKAMSRLNDYGTKKLQSNIEKAIQDNLDRISKMKDRISQCETENDQLANQNDVFRKGAMDGIQMARVIDELSNERERLSVDLADKAITIRKLLEDNKYLTSKVGEVEQKVLTHNQILHETVERKKRSQSPLRVKSRERSIERKRSHTDMLIEQAERENMSSKANQSVSVSKQSYLPHDSFGRNY